MRERILVICFDYLPMVTPNSFRWSALAEYWGDQGIGVDVVCGWQPGLPREAWVNKARVYRVGGGVTQRVRRGVTDRYQDIIVNEAKVGQRRSGTERIVAWSKWLHDRTWKRIYWPDYACLWFLSAYRKAMAVVAANGIGKMITVSFPFTSHLVGYCIKRRRPDTIWVVDIIDPSFFSCFPPTNNRLLYSGLNRRTEGVIFRDSEAVSVLTQSIRDKYAELYPTACGKISVNPNLVHYQNTGEASIFPDDGKMRMVFVGTLDKTTRSPIHVLQAYEMLRQTRIGDRLELHFVGRIDYCEELFAGYREWIARSIFLHGPVSRERAIGAMRSAYVLVNIGNANPFQEPSKVIEYVSCGRPIVNFMTIKDDSSARILGKYPAALNIMCPIRDQRDDQREQLIRFIEEPPAGNDDVIADLVRPYRINSVSGAYLRMLCCDEL